MKEVKEDVKKFFKGVVILFGLAVASVFAPGLFAIAFFLGLWLLPVIVAHKRNHRDENAIAVIVVLLGWSVLPWVLCLAYALVDRPKREVQDEAR